MTVFAAKIVVGGTWKHKRTGVVVAVSQIHRKDGMVLVIGPDGQREYIRFARLKQNYDAEDLYV